MRILSFWRKLLARLVPQRTVPIFYDPAYRLPMTTAQARLGIEPRRADFAIWYLESRGRLVHGDIRSPPRIGYDALARVHSAQWLEALGRPEVLAEVFGLEPWDVPVDEALTTVRLACGGTLAAARLALLTGGPVANLLGGFHHAHPDRGAGLCPVNDVAVAVAALRADGFRGRIGILDLDAHPPDGTAACLGDTVWHGSLSGSDWGPLPHVREIILPEHTGDAGYLTALDGLLGEMPPCDLVFVLAGGDVLAGDPMGRLGLTLAGCAARDKKVVARVGQGPSVWLPAGGYRAEAWKVLTGSLYMLLRGRAPRFPGGFDPMRDRFRRVASTLSPASLGAPTDFDMSDVEVELGLRRRSDGRLLGYYTAEGMEYALFRLGMLAHMERLGYCDFRVEVSVGGPGPGDRVRLWGRFQDEPRGSQGHILMEAALERQARVGVGPVLYVHWLALRHPRSAFAVGRAALPGQDVPGLGMAQEAQNVLGRMAERLGLKAVVVRPAWFHVAYVGRGLYRNLDPVAQGEFDALVRDLLADPGLRQADDTFALPRASREVAAGHVMRQAVDPETGRFTPAEPYTWPASEVVHVVAGEAPPRSGSRPARPPWPARGSSAVHPCRRGAGERAAHDGWRAPRSAVESGRARPPGAKEAIRNFTSTISPGERWPDDTGWNGGWPRVC